MNNEWWERRRRGRGWGVVVQRAKVEESGRREGRWDGTTSRENILCL
jgi:hypothetical protein